MQGTPDAIGRTRKKRGAGAAHITRFRLPRGCVVRYYGGMAEPRPIQRKSDTPPEVLRVQYEIYRQMSPARKFQLIFDTYEMGRQLAMAGLRMRYPDVTPEELRRLWARQHLGRELFDKVYGASGDDRET